MSPSNGRSTVHNVAPGPIVTQTSKEMSKSKKHKKRGLHVPNFVVSDQGHPPDSLEADSSPKDPHGTPRGTIVDESSDAALHVDEAVSESAESEDESAYFTSEDTSVPPAGDACEIGDSAGPYKPASSRLDQGIRDDAASCLSSVSVASCRDDGMPPLEAVQPPRSESRASSSTHSRASLPWEAILNSTIPRDIYETSDRGGVRCLTCAKWFTNFSSFERHYNMSQTHLGLAPSAEPSRVPEFLPQQEDGPPPLVRVASQETLSVQHRSQIHTGRSRSDVSRSRQGPSQRSHHVCKPCKQTFRDITALQRHKSASVREHPFYCQICSVEHDNFEILQMVSTLQFIPSNQ